MIATSKMKDGCRLVQIELLREPIRRSARAKLLRAESVNVKSKFYCSTSGASNLGAGFWGLPACEAYFGLAEFRSHKSAPANPYLKIRSIQNFGLNLFAVSKSGHLS